MKTIFIVLAFSNLIFGATYKETRKVTDSNGKEFTCTYSLFYNTKTVSKSKSSVSCKPNTAGKAVSEEFVIESLGKTVTVKHSIKKGKDAISAVSLKDYVEPTTAAPAPAPASGEAMDCTCRLPGMDNTAAGRNGFQYSMNGEAGSDRKIMKPSALSRGHHGGYYGGGVSTGGSTLVGSLIPLAVVALLAGLAAFGASGLLNTLFPTMVAIIGRSLPVDELAETENDQARLLAKLNDKQLFGNAGNFGNLGNLGNFGNLGNLGNLGNTGVPSPAPAPAPSPASPLLGLLGGSSGGSLDLASLLGAAGGSSDSNDVVNQIAMQIAQQQVDNFLNNGGAEAALTDLVESGKLEEMANTMMESAMENVNTEEIMANIQSNMDESMSGANAGLEELIDNGGIMGSLKLEDMMAGMNMTEMLNGMNLNSMEMEMKCSCIPSA